MSFLPIRLDVRRKFGKSSDGKTLPFVMPKPDLKQRVLARDKHTCKHCGFQSKEYQTVHRLDRNKPATKDSNWVTSCTFCDACFGLDQVGMSGSGVLIWLPEIGQAALNHILRALYVARESDGDMADAARVAFDALMVRRYEARRRLGTDDPLVLATVMLDSLGDEEFNQVNSRVEGIRLLHLDKFMIRQKDAEVNRFPEMVKSWADGPFKGKPLSGWLKELEVISKQNSAA